MRGAVLLLFLSAALVATGQTPPRAGAPTSPVAGGAGAVTPTAPSALAKDPLSAIIRGRVVRADNGQPIEGARLAANQPIEFVFTDTDGRFELTHLRAGTYQLTAYANGFPSTSFGGRGFGDSGRIITVMPGQIVNGIDFALARGAVLSGVVLNERGEPLPLAGVWVLRQQFVNGERRVVDAIESDRTSGAESGTDITDDLGRFRIFGLRPGTYYLGGRPLDADADGASRLRSVGADAPAMYPTGGSIAEAQPLTLAAGQELSGLTFAVRPVRMASITGTLSSRTGPSAGDLTFVQLEPRGTTYGVRTRADGEFSFSRRPPGGYAIFAREGDQVAFQRLELDGADVIVPLTLNRGGAVGGRVMIDSGEPPAGLLPSDVTISGSLLLLPGTSVRTTVRADWSFELAGLVGPIHLTVGSSKGGWFTKQVRVNGSDVTGMPLDTTLTEIRDVEVVLTQQATMLAGSVRDDRGRTAADATVILFAEDVEKRWPGGPYVRAARAGADGRFSLRGVPAARYRAVAVEFLEGGEETNPALIEQLERASTRVTLSHGSTQTLDLRLVPLP